MLRLIHTADWHLGQTLHGIDRGPEHDRFLEFLTDTLIEERADALVVAGDVFDSASPSAVAQQRYYRFVADLRKRLPELQVVILGGNHDSPARLDAPADLLESLGIHVIGGIRRGTDGEIDLDAHLVRLKGQSGDATLLAVPFLRPRDVSQLAATDGATENMAIERFVAGYRELIRRLVARSREMNASERLIATGHCYMAGASTSDDSERKIQMGNQAALPAEIYLEPALDLAYVALGHLHRAQSVDVDHVRYSGSPIPLSLAERSYSHQILIVDVPERGPAVAEPRHVPRSVAFEVVPEEPTPLSEVEGILRARSRSDGSSDSAFWPVLEVRVRLEAPEPKLRERIHAALDGAPARLARISVHTDRPDHPSTADPAHRLEELSAEEIFRQAYLRDRGRPPGPELLELFDELMHQVESEGRREEPQE